MAAVHVVTESGMLSSLWYEVAMHEGQFWQVWFAWMAEGESFQACWSHAPPSIERSIRLAYHKRTGETAPDIREYVQQMGDDAPQDKGDAEGVTAGLDRIVIRSIGPGDTFCSVSYRCAGPTDGGRPLSAFLRYNGAGQLACVAIPNPQFDGLALEASAGEKIAALRVDAIAGDRAKFFFTSSPASHSAMEDVVRAIISRHGAIS